MDKLDLKATVSDQVPEVAILSLRGSLELATLAKLEQTLNEVNSQGHSKVLVDMEGLEYISSSGLGSFLGMVDGFRKQGGDLAFIKLPSKIHKIFSVVGFLRVLKVFSTQEEGLNYFRPAPPPQAQKAQHFHLQSDNLSPHSGEPFNLQVQALDQNGTLAVSYAGLATLKPAWGIVSPAQIGPFKAGVWAGPVILTGPGNLALKALDHEIEGEISLGIMETKPRVTFPLPIQCPGCLHNLQAPAADIFRCNVCNEIFLVDRWGHTISLRQGKQEPNPPAKSLQLNFPADVNLLAHVRHFITQVLKQEAYPEDFINEVEMSCDEAITNIVEHAYQYDSTKNISLRLTLEKHQLTIMLRDNGQPFDPSKLPEIDIEQHIRERKTGGLGRFLMKSFMDSVDYQCNAEGNTLFMTKRVKH